jgi:hypothetical protein
MSNLLPNGTFYIVTHSEGAAFGAGIASFLIKNQKTVKMVVHLSSDEGDEFDTPLEPVTYQLCYKGDWVTGNKPISGVDKFGIVIRNDLGFTTTHGTTKSGDVFKEVEDLTTVIVQSNLDSEGKSFYSQMINTIKNNTMFYRINEKILK